MRCSRTRRTLLIAFFVCGGEAAAAEPVRVPDPGNGPAWTANASTSRAGRTCAIVTQGSTRKGRYCERLGGNTPYSYNVRHETPPDRAAWRTVLTVTLAPEVVSASLDTPERVWRYARGRGPRVLLAVVAGRIEQPPLEVRVRSRGRTIVARGGAEPSALVADPGGGPEWRTVAERRSPQRSCVSWERVPPRFGGPEASPVEGTFTCGDPSLNLPAYRVERVADRLVIVGLAGPAVRGVLLRGPGEPGIAFNRASRSFLAVLPPETDPAQLTLVLALSDGRDVERKLG